MLAETLGEENKKDCDMSFMGKKKLNEIWGASPHLVIERLHFYFRVRLCLHNELKQTENEVNHKRVT
jgi:hypothetical protein